MLSSVPLKPFSVTVLLAAHKTNTTRQHSIGHKTNCQYSTSRPTPLTKIHRQAFEYSNPVKYRETVRQKDANRNSLLLCRDKSDRLYFIIQCHSSTNVHNCKIQQRSKSRFSWLAS